MAPVILPDLMSVTALTFVFLSVISWMCLGGILFLWRWLSKAAGHPIGITPTVKSVP